MTIEELTKLVLYGDRVKALQAIVTKLDALERRMRVLEKLTAKEVTTQVTSTAPIIMPVLAPEPAESSTQLDYERIVEAAKRGDPIGHVTESPHHHRFRGHACCGSNGPRHLKTCTNKF